LDMFATLLQQKQPHRPPSWWPTPHKEEKVHNDDRM
jgi:hypothetical protein